MMESQHKDPSYILHSTPGIGPIESAPVSTNENVVLPAATRPTSEEVLRRMPRKEFDAKLKSFGSLLDPFIFDKPAPKTNLSGKLLDFLQKTSEHGDLRRSLDLAILYEPGTIEQEADEAAIDTPKGFMKWESLVAFSYYLHKDRFPEQIWTCCKKFCFAKIATTPSLSLLFGQLCRIHKQAERHQQTIENHSHLIEERRKGVGTSTVCFASSSRNEREADCEESQGTQRQLALLNLGKFVVEVLPFLYGQDKSLFGMNCGGQKLCTQAIVSILGISRNFLYYRKKNADKPFSDEYMLSCLIDDAGLRMQQHRRVGHRGKYPPVEQLNNFDCGCDVPCFTGVPEMILVSEYEEFSKLSRDLKPRHAENQYLLNRMFCPLTYRTTPVCNRALSCLYTVSESLIVDVRRVLNKICEDPSIENREILKDGSIRYNYDNVHPIRKYTEEQRNSIERTLDMVLRPDPAGGIGGTICRVYSPEVNTREKLHATLLREVGVDDPSLLELSGSTLRRMIQEYLRKRKVKGISFLQSDHNACPTCKTLHFAVLEYHHKAKILEQDLVRLDRQNHLIAESARREREALLEQISQTRFQEDETSREMLVHNERDMRIRGVVKRISDYFRDLENKRLKKAALMKKEETEGKRLGNFWNCHRDRVHMTHQDDMTKVDLPHFFLSASSDITRWRFDVNAHVNAITNDAVVFSHEQGTGSKNASTIIEEILLAHLLSCKGESVKIVLSDNAAVGKNWLTTIALPQYLVDQELAEVALILFLENNHGKYLADMLFGQFQSKRKRSVLLGIDDMLSQFESIRRKQGTVQSFAINPLSSVNFAEVFESLGYETKPSAEFGFVKRNIHFACACKQDVKKHLSPDLMKVLGPALPDEPGMVRISTEPSEKSQGQLYFEDRHFDVPAAKLSAAKTRKPTAKTTSSENVTGDATRAPLVVPLDQKYIGSGPCVVANRTADKVGYNGVGFRNTPACPELNGTSTALVRRAWPKAWLANMEGSDELVPECEGMKCAPVNWVVRRPVIHFCTSEDDWKARYPPRNLLNAKFKKGPRDADPWIPTATYSEPPFPIIEGTAACEAMRALAEEHKDLGNPLHILDVLRAVYMCMGSREGLNDHWLQRRATMPSQEAIQKYRNELQLFVEREHGHPCGAKTARQFFKEDADTAAEAQRIVADTGVTGPERKKLMSKTLTDLFDKAVLTPGRMQRFDRFAAKDLERYSRELKEFKEKQREFDELRGLLPLQ